MQKRSQSYKRGNHSNLLGMVKSIKNYSVLLSRNETSTIQSINKVISHLTTNPLIKYLR